MVPIGFTFYAVVILMSCMTDRTTVCKWNFHVRVKIIFQQQEVFAK
jgi:hypothetical protein